MKYYNLREKVRTWEKYPGCKYINRAPLLNPGFPGTFNISFAEDVWLEEYAGYTDFDHDCVFSRIQSCVRVYDFPLLKTEDSWKYLGAFEMADITGAINLTNRHSCEKLQTWQISELVKFLCTTGIPRELIHPSYNVGGSVKELTEGKYGFDFQIPEDIVSKQAFLEIGIPEENLVSDKSRDTFLSLHVYRPTPWGYRNEVFVNVGSKDAPALVDVATLEYFLWKPIFTGDVNSKNISGLEENNNSILLNVVGLERLCMVLCGLKRVQDVDYILPFYKQLENIKCNSPVVAGESLRALHRIYADIVSYNCSLSKNRKKKVKILLQNIPKSMPLETIKSLLEIHSETQPWHSNLKDGITPTIERIAIHRRA